MKDKIMNAITLLTVAAALLLTLARGGEAPSPAPNAPAIVALPTAAPTASPHPAQAYRERRTETRQQEQAMLELLLNSEYATPEIRAMAQEQALATAAHQETELAVEAALAGKGYGDALCVVRDNQVTVFTGTALTAQDAALIQQLVREASGILPENIRLTGF
ncbi:MAG: SpoIIIAH-like family protein [Clostridia bacterium]|nr:SpoIIIAH-like family protein [Clostridia bacterium]